MAKYSVSFYIEVPDMIPEDDIEEWVKFHVGYTGQMRCENPLANEDIVAKTGTFYMQRH